MPDITIKFKDGDTREFHESPRPGGSWTNRVKYEGSFVIIVDEYGSETAFPSQDVKEVIVKQHSRY